MSCGSSCICSQVIKGKMPDGTPRSLDKVCDGRDFGNQDDVVRDFQMMTVEGFEEKHA